MIKTMPRTVLPFSIPRRPLLPCLTQGHSSHLSALPTTPISLELLYSPFDLTNQSSNICRSPSGIQTSSQRPPSRIPLHSSLNLPPRTSHITVTFDRTASVHLYRLASFFSLFLWFAVSEGWSNLARVVCGNCFPISLIPFEKVSIPWKRSSRLIPETILDKVSLPGYHRS
jgi:hypothetical protein